MFLNRNWSTLQLVRLKIGAVAGIVPESLVFSFQAITADSSLFHAHLEIECIPFRIHCNTCHATTENDVGFALCDACGSTDTKILSGTELNIVEIKFTLKPGMSFQVSDHGDAAHRVSTGVGAKVFIVD